MVKNPHVNSGDMGSIPGSGRSLGQGNGNTLQYSSLGNPMDREAQWATAHGVTKSRTQLSTHIQPSVATNPADPSCLGFSPPELFFKPICDALIQQPQGTNPPIFEALGPTKKQ